MDYEIKTNSERFNGFINYEMEAMKIAQTKSEVEYALGKAVGIRRTLFALEQIGARTNHKLHNDLMKLYEECLSRVKLR